MDLEDLWAVEPSLRSGFYIQPISLLNPIETSKTVSNLYLDPSCNKYCNLIGQNWGSKKTHRTLVNPLVPWLVTSDQSDCSIRG